MSVARVYTLETPFLAEEVSTIGYAQTGDLMILSHLNHDPQVLRRYDHDLWTIGDAEFGTSVVAPLSPVATAVTPNTGVGYDPVLIKYVVTAIEASGRESLASAIFSCTNDLNLEGNYNSLTWAAAPTAVEYAVYKEVNGIYGFIGTAGALTFRDQNIGPDLSDSPATNRQPFSGANDKPAVVTFHQQRATFARTLLQPSGVFASQSADFLNMDVSRPARADDAVTFALSGEQVNAIQHIISNKKALLALTDTAIWSITSSGNFLAPDDIVPQLESKRGSSRVRPVVVDDIVFFNTSKGSAVRTLGYTFEVDGYKGNDITVFAPHLFSDASITWMAWAEYPMSVLWAGRSDGKLLALTWQAEQDVWGWSLCETTGFIESGCVITEDGEDVLYVVVLRVIGETVRRFTERMTTSAWREARDACFLDASRSYEGVEATVFRGLDHLEGQTVVVLADGAVKSAVVEGGAISLTKAASRVHIGLPYEAWVRTLPPAIGGASGQRQQITEAKLAVIRSRGIEVGAAVDLPDGRTEPFWSGEESGPLYPIKALQQGVMQPDPPLYSGTLEIDTPPTAWREVGLIIRQKYPLPMTVTGIYTTHDVEQ